MHQSTFGYLQPTPAQLEAMTKSRAAFADLAGILDQIIPDGPDKTYSFRQLRDAAMWVNIAITRNPDGSPRTP